MNLMIESFRRVAREDRWIWWAIAALVISAVPSLIGVILWAAGFII